MDTLIFLETWSRRGITRKRLLINGQTFIRQQVFERVSGMTGWERCSTFLRKHKLAGDAVGGRGCGGEGEVKPLKPRPLQILFVWDPI